MTRAELRASVIEGANKLLNHAWVLGIDLESRTIIEAERNLFALDDRALDDLYRQLPPAMRTE